MPFAGFEMPLYYQGILAEHRAVRSSVGLFDVSHMGILRVSGPSAARLLSRRTTANAAKVAEGQCRYTFLLEGSGAIIDDLLVTRFGPNAEDAAEYLVVPNAATADGVYDLLRSHRLPDTTVTRHNDRASILAVQGPKSRELLEAEFGWSLAGLRFYTGRWFPARPGTGEMAGALSGRFPDDLGPSYWVSRTGYTGELGFELFVPSEEAVALAERVERRGAVPAGLGARDTLRLEKGYLLSGQDFHRDRSPVEAGQTRFVELDHVFVGRDPVERQLKEGPVQVLTGVRVEEPNAIPRHGAPLLREGMPVGTITSGGLSPTLDVGIALAYLPPGLAAPGTALTVGVRGRTAPAVVVRLPFVPAPSARG